MAKKKSAPATRQNSGGQSIWNTRKQFPEHRRAMLNDIESNVRQAIAAGMSAEEAELWARQKYFENLQLFGEPVAAAQHLMADLKTRIDLDRQLNVREDPVDKKTLQLFEEMRKTIKLMNDTQPRQVNMQITDKDDTEMAFSTFIDVGEEEEVKKDDSE